MKNTFKYIALAAIVGFASCEPEFENSVEDDGFYDTGSADLSTYVAVGNSLTAGFGNNALYISGQNDSYPNIMAGQFALAGAEGSFTQPLMNDDLGGLLLNGSPLAGFGNRLVLSVDENGNPGPTPLEGDPTTEVTAGPAGPFNNMGIPGAKSFHLGAPGYGNVGGLANGTANPYYARIATSGNSTVLGDAVSLNPTFFSLWIGNNDILSYATAGGAGVDQTGNLDPSTYSGIDITDPTVFAASYSAQLDALTAGGAGGVVFNLADVTSIPFFTTVPTRSIPLDQATADLLNSNFALYNTQVLPTLVAVQVITQAEADARVINFTAGVNNFPIMTDDDLTDVSGILQGPPTNLPADLANLLGQLRQVNTDDLVVLRAAGVLGSTPDPSNPAGIVGASIPLADEFVLTATEQGRVATAVAQYNGTIQALAAAKDLAFVDAQSVLAQVASTGYGYNGGLLTSVFATGGGFSLDGVHPTPRGYALVANLAIDAINGKYNANIPTVNIGNYGTITAHNNSM